MSRRAIYNLVRALTHPYIGAHLIYKGEEIKVWRVKEEQMLYLFQKMQLKK
jgi:methionyl-tRNA formyltransferase